MIKNIAFKVAHLIFLKSYPKISVHQLNDTEKVLKGKVISYEYNYEKYRIFPKKLSFNFNWFNAKTKYHLFEQAVGKFSNCFVVGNNSTAITSKRQVVLDPYQLNPYNLIRWGDLKFLFLPKKLYKTRQIDSAFLFAGPLFNNYYHFVIDFLPMIEHWLHLSNHSEKSVKLLLNENAPKFALEYITLLGIRKEQIFFRKKLETLFVRELYIANYPTPKVSSNNIKNSPHYILPTNSFKWVRTKILNQIPSPKHNQSAIYISRKKATSRKIVNESEFIEALDKLSVKTFYLEDMSVIDQINLMQQTHTMITVHGAGMTNLLFMPKNSTIHEIWPASRATFTTSTFYQISFFMNHSHHVWCYNDENEEITINIHEMIAHLRKSLRHKT